MAVVNGNEYCSPNYRAAYGTVPECDVSRDNIELEFKFDGI